MERPTSFHPSNDRISFTINNKNEPVFFFNDLHPLIVEGNFETKKMMLVHQVLRAEKAARLAFQKKKRLGLFQSKTFPKPSGT